MGYFYRGRHRVPSPLARTAAATAATGAFAVVVPLALASPAQAAEAVPTVEWGAIIACESGGNPTAQNASSTASGLYQFLDSSWRAYGGGKYAPRARDATPAQQTEIANAAHARSGLTPWAASKSCWAGKSAPSTKTPARAAPPKRATPAPVVVPASTPAPGNYTVRPGDTLAGIAAARHVSWQDVYQANRATVGSNPNLIVPGQQLAL